MPVVQDGISSAPAGVTSGFNGAVAFRIGATGLSQAGWVSQPPVTGPQPAPSESGIASGPVLAPPLSSPVGGYPNGPGVERALVVGSKLYTVSDTGILVSDLGTFAEEAWLPFP
jgi:hypothetical protein